MKKKKSRPLVQLSEKASRDFLLYASARDLPGMANFIYQMALEGDTKFFKQLGKALSGRKNTSIGVDKREAFVLQYYVDNPNGTAADCMSKMEAAGFHPITEENFRVLKMRLYGKAIVFHDGEDIPDDELRRIWAKFKLQAHFMA